VTREYVGVGRVARLAAEIDAEARARRAAEGEALRRYRHRLEPLDRLSAEVDAGCALLTAAALLAAGYHRHGSEWRLRRVPR
jgi:hypothetical protein